MKTKLTFLMDDKPGEGLLNEHGLSILIETGESKILFDTGQSSRFSQNAENLDIDLSTVDFALISHGHYDHGGGLPAFLKVNNSAPVYMHPKAALPIYYSKKAGSEARYVGIKQDTFTEYPERFDLIDNESQPVKGIHIIPCTAVEGRGPIFKDKGLFLMIGEKESPETFDHEIFMVIERKEDIIVISGCSHNNILAIIEHARKTFPDKSLTAVIGGFHMPDIKDYSEEHVKAVQATADALKQTAIPLFLTGHCTGDRAKVTLKAVLREKIDFFHTGFTFLL